MDKITIASAGNTLAPALSVLKEIGYNVSLLPEDTSLLLAQSQQYRLIAEDPLQLLGLAMIASHRGALWQPTDVEISELLALEHRK